MFFIDKNQNIKLTKGDTAMMKISVCDLAGKPYEIKDNDVITMTIKTSQSAQSAALSKVADQDHFIELSHSDTSSLAYGLYVYDVQLVTEDEKYYTIIPTRFFELTNEVTA